MTQCAEAAAVAATVPGAGMGKTGLRPSMVPRQASFFPPPVPNPFVQQTRMGAASRLQVRAEGGERSLNEGRGVGLKAEAGVGEGLEAERKQIQGKGLDLKGEAEPGERGEGCGSERGGRSGEGCRSDKGRGAR